MHGDRHSSLLRTILPTILSIIGIGILIPLSLSGCGDPVTPPVDAPVVLRRWRRRQKSLMKIH